jgi:hypothetical protein
MFVYIKKCCCECAHVCKQTADESACALLLVNKQASTHFYTSLDFDQLQESGYNFYIVQKQFKQIDAKLAG